MLVFMQFSTKIDCFEQKDSQGFENSYNSYEQYPLEKFFIFTIYQKLYFGFKIYLYLTLNVGASSRLQDYNIIHVCMASLACP